MDDESTPEIGSRFRVTSTSNRSATVSPLVLRQSEQVRLVFKPMIVENRRDPDALLKGTLCYQRKRRSDDWEDVEAISLNSLRAGEGVKLDLHSEEILKLFRGLDTLYRSVASDGVPSGTHTYIRADRGTILADVADLLETGGVSDLLEVFLRWVQADDEDGVAEAMRVNGEALINFDAVVGAARLQAFVNEATANITNGQEAYWQALLARNAWAISQIYAAPLVIVREQAYVGGKSIANAGGTIVDYLFRNSLSSNSLLVELKTPTTPLLTTTTYRNRIYGPSTDLGGATQQLLHARQVLQETYLSLAREEDSKFNIFGTKALLIIGSLSSFESDAERIRSFEIYRNAHRGLDIVTFDELIEKARLLLEALTG